MPVMPLWADTDKTMLYLLYEQPWNTDDFQAAVKQCNKMLDEVSHSVDMVICMYGGLPRELGPWNFRSVMNRFHPNIRLTALVGANDFVRSTITAFMRVLGKREAKFFFAESLEDALAKLAQRGAAKTA